MKNFRNILLASCMTMGAPNSANADELPLAEDILVKQEAEKIKDGLVREFPTCFVIKELINLPRVD